MRSEQKLTWASFLIGLLALIPTGMAQGLWDAAGMNDIVAMERQAKAGASLTALNERGLSPIQVAAMYGSREAAIWLLEHGADVNTRSHRDTPLSLACANGHVELARELLRRGAKYHRHDDGLRQAALAGHTECVRLLLEQGVQLNAVTARELIEGILKAGRVEPLILLRQAQRKWRKLENNPSQQREEELLRAAFGGEAARVQALLGSPDGLDEFALRAALTLARQQGHIELIEMMRARATPAVAAAEHRRKLGQAMWDVIGRGGIEEVRSRLHAGAEMESRWLEDAVSTGKPDMVRLILDYGADIDERYTAEKQTVLYQAAAAGRTELVRLLLARGADADVPDVDGVTPLQIALRNRHADVAELLRKRHDASPN